MNSKWRKYWIEDSIKAIFIIVAGILIVFGLFYLITQPLYKIYNPNTEKLERGGELCWNYYQYGNVQLEEVTEKDNYDFRCDYSTNEIKFLRWKK